MYVCVCVCARARSRVTRVWFYDVYEYVCLLPDCVCRCMSVHARHNANIHSMQTTDSAQAALSVQPQGVHDDVASRLQPVGTETPRGWELRQRESHSPPFKTRRCHRQNDAAESRKEEPGF